MEPVKTCATCRHSVVGRRDPMDWWKLRLCAHPGLVDRVEGRPLYSCVDARGREGACAAAGTLWEAVPATDGLDCAIRHIASLAVDKGALLDPVDVQSMTVPEHLLPRPRRKPRAPREGIE
jgi:hypothetical protein